MFFFNTEANDLVFSSALGEIGGHNNWTSSCDISTPEVHVNDDTGTFKMVDSPDNVDSSCAVYVDNGAYVDLGDFAGNCVSDPDVCVSEIVSWSIWIKLNSTDRLRSGDRYYISVGGRTSGAHGIALLHQQSNLFVSVRSYKRRFIGYFNLKGFNLLPMDTWFHFGTTVDLTQTNKSNIVKIYLNGEIITPVSSDIGDHSSPNDGNTNLVLGRENAPTGQEPSETTIWSSAAYSSLTVFDGLWSDADMHNIHACGSIGKDLSHYSASMGDFLGR